LKKILSFFIVPLFFFSSWPGLTTTLTKEQATIIVGNEIDPQALNISEFNGITLIGITPPESTKFDVTIVPAKRAINVIKQALALIEKNSPFSKSQIELLKMNGPVIIVYDPRYPKKEPTTSSVKIALFSPFYYSQKKKYKTRHTFLVIVSRHGAKWPIKELAAVLVHELVGHGTQYLNGKWNKMRLVDMECEAWLYEEMAYQNLKMDKFSTVMINFKKQLEKQCESFLRYLKHSDSIGETEWNKLNPDVLKLLEHFAFYQKQLKKQ